MNEEELKVCRLCLRLLFKEKFFDINYVEPISGFMPFRDQITTCMPELALDILPECFICLNCADSLKAAYEFKNNCLMIEERIKQYFDSLSPDSSCELLSLSKFARHKSEEENLSENENNISLDLEIPCAEVREQNIEEVDLTAVEPSNAEESFSLPSFVCSICQDIFRTTRELVKHKKTTHCSPFVCNFCNQEFRSLFLLRQHNTLCKDKESKIPWGKASQKRPHLPAKAKNHLTEWLFHHQQHPYPTDYEKQCLMKETNLTLVQVENWFINARRRVLLDFSRRRRYISKIKPPTSESQVLS
ncbi:uncharacterized protein LOC123320268 [Coccinella septempunctata]|uniref:uncharacterized protein LOC123320268 n=1 Tax=Coccinella septempunctata TaxID=41139 RepID=UPI001D05EAD4|nr:uncharacterized protein LOC123320268 [Coccinella septempunctata]